MTTTLSLFGERIADPVVTEGIKYAGSKLKLLPQILSLVARTGAKSVLDGFSGSTRVAQALAKSGYRVIANDIAVWSEILGTAYLKNTKSAQIFDPLIRHLNAVSPCDGWFTENYGGLATSKSSVQADGRKRPWQIQNTRKLDAIRDEIDNLSLTAVERAVALTSLMLALDRVDSTMGHFVSYLNEWSPRSFNPLHLEVPLLVKTNGEHEVIKSDVFEASKAEVDLAYFDPPYGSNNEKMPPSRVRYQSYYHVWTSICLNDKPDLFGKAMRRKDCSDTVAPSVFEDFRKNPKTDKFVAVEAIERLIKETRARWIILSYSSGGRATAAELNGVLTRHGRLVDVIEINYARNVMAEMRWTSEWVRDADVPNREFLFLLQK